MPVALIRSIWETAKATADEAARLAQEKKGQEGLRALRAELDRVGVSTDDFLKRYYAPKATPDYLTRYRIPPPGVGAALPAERPITAAPTPTPTPTPTAPVPMRIEQAPLTPEEEAAVQRGELGGPPTGPTITALGVMAIPAGIAVSGLAAAAAKFPVLAAILGEGILEEKGIIPGRPVGRLTELAAGPMRENLTRLGVPEEIAAPLSEIVVWGAIGKAPAGQRSVAESFAALRRLPVEDVKASVATLRRVATEEAGGARIPGEKPPVLKPPPIEPPPPTEAMQPLAPLDDTSRTLDYFAGAPKSEKAQRTVIRAYEGHVNAELEAWDVAVRDLYAGQENRLEVLCRPDPRRAGHHTGARLPWPCR